VSTSLLAPPMSATGPSIPAPVERLPRDQLLHLFWIQAAVRATTAFSVVPRRELVLLIDPSATSGAHVWIEPATQTAREVLNEIKGASGLTWDQVARIMGVSRRSVHMWLNAKPMASENEERVHRVRQIIGQLGRRSQLETRSRLLDTSDGDSVFRLLVEQDDDGALALAKQRALSASAPTVFDHAGRRLSDEARASRASTMSQMDLLESGTGPADVRPARGKRATRSRRARDEQ
jgi:hypothetical protein